ncbi:hypothetical protein [Flammeovirga sp. SubArs3]|uniref:hypothetical protein n=1 Tax=Flammeovirga sp. SubArs3 TaxID=2995316 RepID=UPI00248BE4AF|nr:hypothetical protein [Flammeovirga sp. SubArs3]
MKTTYNLILTLLFISFISCNSSSDIQPVSETGTIEVSLNSQLEYSTSNLKSSTIKVLPTMPLLIDSVRFIIDDGNEEVTHVVPPASLLIGNEEPILSLSGSMVGDYDLEMETIRYGDNQIWTERLDVRSSQSYNFSVGRDSITSLNIQATTNRSSILVFPESNITTIDSVVANNAYSFSQVPESSTSFYAYTNEGGSNNIKIYYSENGQHGMVETNVTHVAGQASFIELKPRTGNTNIDIDFSQLFSNQNHVELD